MKSIENLRKLSFLVYGLGITGKSVVNFFKRNEIKNYLVWDDENKNLYKKKRTHNLNKTLKEVDYIILSPGISLENSKNKTKLFDYKNKIITDLDLIFSLKNFLKSVVVTGSNGKSTTCKIISHVLKKNNFKILLGGNIGTPILNLKIKKNSYIIIEASSFQLAHSKFIRPDYAILLNITNDHLDWHGTMKNYVNSKFKIFNFQTSDQFSLVNKNFKNFFKKRKLHGKLVIPNVKTYKKFKSKIKNTYIKSKINDENMSFVFTLSKILGMSEKSFFKSLNSFKGLPHRYELFLKKKNCLFINDSKATSFQSTKLALKNTENIFWIVGGLPKKNDKIILNDLKKNVLKCYIIGNHFNFFKQQLKNQISCLVTKNLKNSIIQILKDIKSQENKYNTILLSPASASYDQFLNFENRGNEFKRLCNFYASKYI